MEWVREIMSPEVQAAARGLFDVALLGAIGYAAELLRRKFGVDVSQKRQNDLHRALMTGASAMLAGRDLGQVTAEVREQIVLAVIAYAKQSVPDAIAKLSPGGSIPDGVLDTLARAKLNEVANRMTSSLGK